MIKHVLSSVLTLTTLCTLPAAASARPHLSFAFVQLGGNACPFGLVLRQESNGAAHLGNALAAVNATAPLNCNEPAGNIPWDGYASAETDLFSGRLHAVSYARSDPHDGGGAIGTIARAVMLDTITLHGQGEGYVRMGLDLEGLVDTTGDGIFGVTLCLGVSRGDEDPIRAASCRQEHNNLGYFGTPTHLELDWLLTQNLWASPEPINIFASLDVSSADGWRGGRAVADVGHTAHLRIEIPDGMSFTSESGLLLRQPPVAALPASSTALLTVFGLAGLLGSRRGRRA